MRMTQIVFGTDGWRGLIADDFTFDNLRKVDLATANYFKKQKKVRNGAVIGYDSRFLSKEFAEATAEVLANRGIKVIISDKISSTPMVSLLTKKLKATGGVVITASHNPARYNGFKIKGDFGGPAHPEMIEKVENELKKVLKSKVDRKKSFDELVEKGNITKMDFTAAYIGDLRSKLDIPLIERSGLKIAYDAMFGAGQGVFSQLVKLRAELRNAYNPSFGGTHPEPILQNIQDLASAVVVNGCDIGIATDGDADRIGAIDEQGSFVDSHRIFAILLNYLVTEEHMTGEIAKSNSVSQMIVKMCAKYGLKLHETPVGFKYIGELIGQDKLVIGGEESAGLTIKGHVPEKDGILACFLVAEMVAREGKSIRELLDRLYADVGRFVTRRDNLKLSPELEKAYSNKINALPAEVAGTKVTDIVRVDGTKLLLEDGSWMLFRKSGTEPVVRLYGEAGNDARLAEVMAAGRKFILS